MTDEHVENALDYLNTWEDNQVLGSVTRRFVVQELAKADDPRAVEALGRLDEDLPVTAGELKRILTLETGREWTEVPAQMVPNSPFLGKPLPEPDEPLKPGEIFMDDDDGGYVRSKVAYISGPIRNAGPQWANYFNYVAEKLRSEGWSVLNPAEWEKPGKTTAEYMVDDVSHVAHADAVFMLPGWENSEGARLEYQVAKITEKEIYFVDAAVAVEPAEMAASNLVRSGAREAQYGPPLRDFARTALIWTGVLRDKLLPHVQISEEDVALAMTGLKLSRLAADYGHRDSLEDAHGYLITLERVVQAKGQSRTPMYAPEEPTNAA